ncbi:MAG TPA: monovalent cation:proton antiporter-2 (CPA2) family protein [Burkholderiales bacterium]|nr:monovalent cation:proton antiporter-2 (CPA2) family protein [Burkholderiales bacterium]
MLVRQLALLLLAAVVIVPLFQRLKLGAVLGYLVAGIVVGPWVLHAVDHTGATLEFAELGVVLLLFVIGLELEPARLWALRGPVFGLGSAQMAATTALVAAVARAAGLHWGTGVIIGFALALSSTALVMALLEERGELARRYGREAFSILLFQDVAVIPVLALLPLLAPGAAGEIHFSWSEAGKIALLVGVVLSGGRYIVRPALNFIAIQANREIFTAAALLLVIAAALGTELVGLSMSLGAFLAGVILADSELRHELEADIEPFKGLLMGLFFMAVGMNANLGVLLDKPALVLGLTALLLAGKAAVMYVISRLSGAPGDSAQRLAVALAQGGEFAFVLLTAAVAQRVLPAALSDLLIMVVTMSLLAAPLLIAAHAKVLALWTALTAVPEYDVIEPQDKPVIIAGFGRFGQIVGRVLRMSGIPFTALEISYEQVDFVRKYGGKIYYGDASRLELLAAAGATRARLFVLAIDDVKASIETARVVRQHFPALPIIARAHNRVHYFRLRDLGVEVIHREVFAASAEAAVDVLRALGMADADAVRAVALFREHDEKLLVQQYSIHENEDQLIQTTKQAAEQLQEVFEQDAAGRREAAGTQDPA